MDWYEENIEEPVREVVRALRNKGYNTECSCGHEMYVQCQYIPDGEIQRLHSFIYNYLYKKGEKIYFDIDIKHHVIDGNAFSSLDIRFPVKKRNIDRLKAKRDYFKRRIELLEEDIKKEESNPNQDKPTATLESLDMS